MIMSILLVFVSTKMQRGGRRIYGGFPREHADVDHIRLRGWEEEEDIDKTNGKLTTHD